MNACISFAVLFTWLPLCTSQSYRPIITIGQGALRGTLMKTSNGRDFYAFRGIPYATPPVSIFRFKEPIPHAGWGGVLDAIRFRQNCPQYDLKGQQTGDEDCLYINVYTPTILPISSDRSVTYPVMVWIHGRTFDSGSSSLYGGEKLLDKGVIVVTFNYRLGVLGFLSTNDNEAPGNWGLLDQRMALRWVHNNIVKFGGDSDAVTLFGQGSGAVSVMLHLISPSRQGLFHRAILQSGSPLCDWAIQKNPKTYAINFASRIGCSTSSSENIVKCIRDQPLTSILRVQQEMKTFGDFPVATAPVVDKNSSFRFLPDHPEVLLQLGNFKHIPLMAGVNRDEGLFFHNVLSQQYREDIRSDRNYFSNTLLPTFLKAATDFTENLEGIVEELVYQYFGGIDTSNSTQLIQPFTNMSTDGMFVSCIDKTLQLYSRLSSHTYMYTFEFRGTNSLATIHYDGPVVPIVEAGISNGDELLYLFNLHVNGLRMHTHLDNLITNRILTLWTDFAKFGKAPQFTNYEYPEWKPYSSERKIYYRIDRGLSIDIDYRPRSTELWLRKLNEISENVNPTNSPLVQSEYVESFYKTLAWAMVAICIALLVLIVVLLAILFNQKKSQSFKASHENQSRMSGSTLY